MIFPLQKEITVPEICFSVSSSAVLLWILSILAGRQGHKMHNCLKFLKLASWPRSQWHLQLFNYTHMPLSSYIMLSNKSKCTFFPLGGYLERKAFVLCVNQHIYILVGYIWTRDTGVHLLHYSEYIVLRNSQKG